MAAAVLLLFDIDGTLVSGATDAHRDAMHEALDSQRDSLAVLRNQDLHTVIVR